MERVKKEIGTPDFKYGAKASYEKIPFIKKTKTKPHQTTNQETIKKGNVASDLSGNSPEGKKLMTQKGHWELSIEGVFCSY